MSRRSAGPVWVVLLGLLPGLGCATATMPAPLAPLTPVTARLTSSSAKPTAPDLPPAQAADLCVMLGRSLEHEGHDLEAIGQYELARHYKADTDVSRRLAVLYDRVGDASRAMPEYERAVKAHPRDPDLLNDLGYHHYNLGRWADAEKALRQALEIDPRHGNAWTNLGMTLAQEGRHKESLEAFQHCVSAGEAQCNLGFLLTTQGNRKEARAAYEEALRLQPGLRLAQAALAKLDEAPRPAPAAKPTPATPPEPSSLVAAASPKPKPEPSGPAPAAPPAPPQPPPPAEDALRTVSTQPTEAAVPAAPPSPGLLASAAGTSGWVIPGAAPKGGDKSNGGTGALPPVPSPAAGTLPPAAAPVAASPDGRWIPPPPVPQRPLPPDLQPVGPAPAAGGR
jgi:Tfp pilus assembly protein PilF